MSDPSVLVIVGAVQTILLAVLAAVVKVWTDRNHAATQASIEVVRKDVNGKMEKLLAVTAESAQARGKLEGAAEEKRNPS